MPRIRPKIDTERLVRELAAASKAAVPGDPVTLYLASRGLRYVPPCLRFVPKLKYNAEPPTYHPGMVALFRGPDGKACTFHRTYLTVDGRKASVESPKRLMAGAVAKGGAIRLFPPAEQLGIAEGIETALSAAELHGIPCWSAISENILRDWMPPPETKRVVIFGDNDANFVGHAASYDLARRLSLSDKFDVEVEVRLPPIPDHDWNDILLAALARRKAKET